MGKLEEKAKSLNDGVKEIIDLSIKSAGMNLFERDSDTVMLMKKTVDITNQFTVLMLEEAKTIDEMNEKLDKILKKLEK